MLHRCSSLCPGCAEGKRHASSGGGGGGAMSGGAGGGDDAHKGGELTSSACSLPLVLDDSSDLSAPQGIETPCAST